MKNKIIKTSLILGLITLLVVPCVKAPGVSATSNANTLGELKSELAAYKKKMQAAESGKAQTQSEINAAKNAITKAQKEIETNEAKRAEAEEKIKQLNVEIEETDKEIKDLLRSYEIMNGDNNFLEYIFGATSISDFIIRYSVSEQIANYNDSLITEYENKVNENERLKVELNERDKELERLKAEKQKAIESLGNKRDSLEDEALKWQEEVKTTQELVDFYVKQGCTDSQSLSTCVKVVSDTGFARPLKKGVRTSNFGYRWHPTQGIYKLHSGIDIGGNAEGTPVYSVARGMVGKIVKRSSCGGNMVYIYHTIKGVQYTSTYMHLLSINVKVGDMVTSETVIGKVGGGRSTMGYDRCSTGAHLHLSLAKGWYGKTYLSYSTWVSNLLDPGLKQYVNIPGYGKYFYSRTW